MIFLAPPPCDIRFNNSDESLGIGALLDNIHSIPFR